FIHACRRQTPHPYPSPPRGEGIFRRQFDSAADIGDPLASQTNGGGRMAEFQLYIGNKCFSSWSLRPWVAMEQCGIPFEETTIRLRTPETAANLAKVSPTGTVPVL